MPSNLIITTVDDNPHYQEGLKVFLTSLAKNAPKEKVFVWLINCCNNYENNLHNIYDHLTTKRTRARETSRFTRNYMRWSIIRKKIKTYDKILWLDNDAIIRAPLDGIWEGVGEDTLKIWYKESKIKDHLKFQSGVFVLGKGKKSNAYCRTIMRKLKKCDGWYSPQLLMYTIFGKSGLEHIQLKEKYNDSKFKNASKIWHCKSSHFLDKEYQKEYREYLYEKI